MPVAKIDLYPSNQYLEYFCSRTGHGQSGERSDTLLASPAEVKQGGTAFCFQAVNKHPFQHLFSAMLFTFLSVSLLLEMALQRSVGVLSGVPQCKKAGVYFLEKVCVLSFFLQAGVI